MRYIETIQSIFPKESLDKLIVNILKEYSDQSVENSVLLLTEIPNITKDVLIKKNEQLIKSKQALYWLICHSKTKRKDWNAGMLVPICMENYPNGCIENHCIAEQEFFSEFLDFLSCKKNFDWEKDKRWAMQYGYWQWLCKVKEANELKP